jgi:cytochrome c
LTIGLTAAAQSPPKRFGIGTPATPEQITALDIDVRPDGAGLPQAAELPATALRYTRRNAPPVTVRTGKAERRMCSSAPSRRIPRPFGPEYERWKGARPDVPFTIGNYWPYATTLFDYVRRAMPATAPGSLTRDETYALVAWLLAKNEIIAESDMMNRETLPRVRMPARSAFVPDNRRGGAEVK